MRKDIKVIAGLAIMGTAMTMSNVYADNQEGIVNANVLNIRSGPSTNYTVLTQVKSGDKLQILEKNNEWYKVKLSNGITGYGSEQYININKNNTSANNSINMEGKKGQVKVNTTLNVRKGPSTNYEVVSRLRNNDIVNLLEKSNGWYKVKLSNGTTGWVIEDYISIYTGSTTNTDSSTKVQAILKTVREQLGKPYVWGAEGPNSFDCSGLVYYTFGKHGVQLPRVSRDQYKVGNGKMIHAPNSKSVVKEVDINNSYWSRVYVGAKRLL